MCTAIRLIPTNDELRLIYGRVHEACGTARRTMALWLAAQTEGPVVWIGPSWNKDRLNPEGMTDWVDPGRFIFVDAVRAEDVLWSLEESLRSGAVRLVVGDLPGLPGLTQVRRLHLAAETGGKEGPHLPLGLILTPDQGGAQGVETRWHLNPDHHATQQRQWRLKRLRARTAPPATWVLARPTNTSALQLQRA
ncbi:MAG: ImuA family protein [Paracoccaceae bacterium]